MRSAIAGIHPVPLEKNVNSAKCLECHEDKTKGKTVHPAVSMGCLTCHLVRNWNETTRVNLKTARIATLCFGCHADKHTQNPRQVHAPAAQDCLKCHDAHTSSHEQLLLKPTSGSKSENLCLGCHDQGLNVPDKGSRHAALDMGCGACHATHKVGETGKPEFDFHLTKATPELCLECHDTKDVKLVQSHQAQPFARSSCTSCHDPHASQSTKLLQKYLHPPFSEKSCEVCHEAPANGKVVLTQKDTRALCVSCHDEPAKKIEAAKVVHPGAQGDCTACHNPHAGGVPKFMQRSAVAACESCHSEKAEIHKTKKVLHQPAFKQGCNVCHTPHGGEREHLLRADANHLCLACHGPNAKGAKVADGSEVTIFEGAVRLPAAYFNQVRILPLDDKGLGHPQEKHPVAGVPDPSDPQKKKMITCLSCHNPHGGGRALLVTGIDTTGPLCSRCHKLPAAGAAGTGLNPATMQDRKPRRKK